MDEATTPRETGAKAVLSYLYDWIEIFAVSIAAVFLMFTFVFRVAVVDGPSMKETLHHGDMLIVSEMFYKPQPGDVIVFQCSNSVIGYDEPLVKRVIATEGQVVYIDFQSWTVAVAENAESEPVVIDEPYVNRMLGYAMNSATGHTYPYEVPKGQIFVMGDNRNESLDSRSSLLGPVDARNVLGHVIFRFFPLTDISVIRSAR